jgi:hypothetical protein
LGTTKNTPEVPSGVVAAGGVGEKKVKQKVKQIKRIRKPKQWTGPTYSQKFVLPENFHFVCFEEARLVKIIETQARKIVRPNEYATVKEDGRHNVLERVYELIRIRKTAERELDDVMKDIGCHVAWLKSQQHSDKKMDIVEFHKLTSLMRVQRAEKLIRKITPAIYEREKLNYRLMILKKSKDEANKKEIAGIRKQITALRKNISRWVILKSNLLD